MISLAFLSLTLLPFVAAQDDSATQLAAIKAHFTQSQIVADLFDDSFDPTALLTVNFPGVGDITPGQTLSQDESGGYPTLTLTSANSSSELGDSFTVAMIDASYVGNQDDQVTRHWLLNGATLSDDTISNSSATAITEYGGPAPPEGDPAHRYVIVVYQQPPDFSAPEGLNTANIGISAFNFKEYVQNSNLGPLLAANYYQVQTGTATSSVAETSAVESDTLSASATGSSSGSGTSSGAGSSPSESSESDGAMAVAVSKLAVVAGLAGFLLA